MAHRLPDLPGDGEQCRQAEREAEQQAARTLAEHLPEGYTADGPSSSLTLQGGDVHRSLFRMADATAAAAGYSQRRPAYHRRLATFHGIEADFSNYEGSGSSSGSVVADGVTDGDGEGSGRLSPMPVREMMAPQGFRRDFVRQLQQQQQLENQQKKQQDMLQRQVTIQRRRTQLHLRRVSSFGAARLPITRNFVEFLALYGHFADEDLEMSDGEEQDGDEDEEDGEAEERVQRRGGDDGADDLERQPLLRHDMTSTTPDRKKAGMTQAFFTLFKAFVGTGIVFLPKAYNNGGMVFSTVTLLTVSLLSMTGFRLLLACRQHCATTTGGRGGGAALGYGDIGLAIAGPRMRQVVLASIALSQLGFVCAGLVFCAENLASFAAAVAMTWSSSTFEEDRPLSTPALIALEVAVLVPLALVRDIARLGLAALLGDVCIVLGLSYMYSFDVASVAARGWRADPTVAVWFNPGGYALTVGAAIFTFEGIGLILPIQSSMAQPSRFGPLLGLVMALITLLYVSVGALGYAAFGTATHTEVLDNYPRDSRLAQAVQGLYALAVLAGLPVQLFPAARILEGALTKQGRVFEARRGKRDPRAKWAKNALRTAAVMVCGAVAVGAGAGRLDQFVALIGSLACVPLLFIYPPYLHLRAGVSTTAGARAADVALMAAGVAAMVFTTTVTVAGSFFG